VYDPAFAARPKDDYKRGRNCVPEHVSIDVQELLASPDLFLQSLDFADRSAIFTEVSESELSATRIHSFTRGRTFFRVPFDNLYDALDSRSCLGVPRFIFMTDFCGSTLLFSLLASLSGIRGLNEISVLAMFALMRRAIDRGRSIPETRPISLTEWQKLLRLSLGLLARTSGTANAVIVKEWPLVNNIITDILAAHPSSRAIFLYSSLEDYANSVFRRSWRRRLVRERVVSVFSETSVFPMIHHGKENFSDAQCVAAHWFLQQAHFLRLSRRVSGRIRSLHDRELFSDPVGACAATASHMGVSAKLSEVRAAYRIVGPRYSKNPRLSYSMEDRIREFKLTRAAYGREIDAAMAQVESWSRLHAVPKRLPWALEARPRAFEVGDTPQREQ
jgi:hypothetical protein